MEQHNSTPPAPPRLTARDLFMLNAGYSAGTLCGSGVAAVQTCEEWLHSNGMQPPHDGRMRNVLALMAPPTPHAGLLTAAQRERIADFLARYDEVPQYSGGELLVDVFQSLNIDDPEAFARWLLARDRAARAGGANGE